MGRPFAVVVRDFGWIHLSIGLIGNILFLIGSILFLPRFEPYKTFATWLFISGAFLMLIGSIGRLIVDLHKNRRRYRRQYEKQKD
ncbi:YrhK family protein [Gayadomonas joobiniege]|uniref:YrhK family protein n=1 Tax=Gayadomonas joobiniege TaxID=1234606 RepID=UPI00036349BD|nr:YrhK family protein [Gayadomonas joobiniege]